MKSFYEFLQMIQEQEAAQFPRQVVNPMADPTNKGFSAQANQVAGDSLDQADKAAQKQKLQDILGKDYETFVQMLGQNIGDPKFLKFLQSGLEDGMKQDDIVKFAKINAPCVQLIPTQNEVDLDKSLAWSLTKTPSATLLKYFQGVPSAPGGPIITCCGGKYVIDGHHRWSQLYCMNPQCPIQCIDMSSMREPKMALKVAQIGTVAQGTYNVQSAAPGNNLFVLGEAPIKAYVAKKMGPEAYAAFSQLAQQQAMTGNSMPSNITFTAREQIDIQSGGDRIIAFAQDYIWKNVQSLQSNNQPISGAPKRDFMPQTGDSAAGFMRHLAAGKVNWNTAAK